MDHKEPKKRVTKSDKKAKKQVYSQKHIRNNKPQTKQTHSQINHFLHQAHK